MLLKGHAKKTLVTIIILATLVFTIIIAASYRQTQLAHRSASLVAHTQEVLFNTANVLATINENVTNARGFSLTGQREFEEATKNSKEKIYSQIDLLQQLTTDNIVQQRRIDSLLIYTRQRLKFSDSIIQIKKHIGYEAVAALVATGQGRIVLNNIKDLVENMQVEEQRLLEIRKAANTAAVKKEKIVFFTIVFFMLIMLITFFLKQKDRIEQEEQQKSQAQLASLIMQIDQANDAIYTIDNKRKIISWNKGAEKLYGYSAAEAAGKDPNEILQTGVDEKQISKTLKVLIENNYWSGELKRKTKAGVPVDVHSSVTTIRDAENNITGYVSVSFDITAQKKLKEQLNHQASMVEQSSEAIISVNLNRQIISWNKGAEKLHGYTAAEVLGKTSESLGLINMTAEQMASDIKQLTTTGEFKKELEFYHKNGTSFFGALAGNLLKDEEGNITSLVFFVKDITLSKQLEEVLKKNNAELEEKVAERTREVYKTERKFRALIENNNDIISLFDNSFRVLYRSPSAVRTTGWSNEEVKSIDGRKNIHPDDVGYAEKIIGQLMLQPGEPKKIVFRHLHKNGSYRWMEGTIVNLLQDEVINAIVLNARDISERIEAEEKLIKSEKIYKTIASSIPGSVICMFDEDYRYLLIEGDMLEKLGYKRELLLNNKAADVLPPDLFNELKTDFDHVFKGHIITREYSLKNYDVIAKFIPLKDDNEKVYAIMTVTIDITELKNAQRSIIDLNKNLEEKIVVRTEQLKKSNEELEAFSYSVSHDLRAPLRAVIGFTSILEEEYTEKLGEEAKRITAIIKNNTKKMGNLIDDLLAFSRTGRQDIVKTKMDTRNLIDTIITDFDNKTNGYQKITWKLHPLPEVIGDYNTMRQVWVNLISNAVKYAAHAEPPVIEIGATNQAGNTIFYVKDNGVGFDEKYKEKLFKVFQRLHSSQQFEGTGIGLAIVEKIISKHGGKVWVEAEIDKGATFYFSLPDEEVLL